MALKIGTHWCMAGNDVLLFPGLLTIRFPFFFFFSKKNYPNRSLKNLYVFHPLLDKVQTNSLISSSMASFKFMVRLERIIFHRVYFCLISRSGHFCVLKNAI